MQYRVTHITKYDYQEQAGLCHNEVWMLPRDSPFQRCKSSKITIVPDSTAYREWRDFFGNRVCFFSIQQPHSNIRVTVVSDVELLDRNIPTDFSKTVNCDTAKKMLIAATTPELLDAKQFTFSSPLINYSEEIHEYAKISFLPERPILEAVNDLMQRIHHDFDFVSGFTTIATPLSDVLKFKKGVCQDFAHLAIACVRSVGLAARYVSGYIETLPPPGKERLIGADASHAWYAAYIPEYGWIDFDPTNNLLPNDKHVTVAWGRDYSDVTPLKGVIYSGGGEHRLSVSVDVLHLG
jgi:transglutaminase-like putative cysteine protease